MDVRGGQLLVPRRGGTLIDLHSQSVEDAVAIANVSLASQGLEVRATPGSGYGLFVTRPFGKGTVITEYGGVYHKPCGDLRGDYVLGVKSKHCAWDTERFFYAHDGGRWINEPPLGQMWRVNVEGRHTGKRYYFVAGRDIAPGEELFLDYGDEYEAPWRLPVVLASGDRVRLQAALVTAREVLARVRQWAAEADRSQRGRAEFELRNAAQDVEALEQALARLGCALCQGPASSVEQYPGAGQAVPLLFCSRECQLQFYKK